MTEYRFIRPLDVLFLRGNRLFGGPGDHAEALMPPWPSLAAGALRSRMLVDGHEPLEAFANGERPRSEPLARVLGTVREPGSFRVSLFTLGKRANGGVEPLFPVPADLFVPEDTRDGGEQQTEPMYLRPQAVEGVRTSCALPELAVLRTRVAAKAKSGLWLSQEGLRAYLAGGAIANDRLVSRGALWRDDPRLGIALDAQSRTAAEGQIYTTDTVALCDNVGFLVGVDGADGLVPKDGLLRFGGDGRAAAIQACAVEPPRPNLSLIESERRFRVILATPGVFARGWRLAGLGGDNVWRRPGFTARLVAAAVPRFQVISGWDLAKWEPKSAVRAVPAGAVYWFEEFDGEAEALQALLRDGLWAENGDRHRRAEGYNNVLIAAWPRDDV